MKMVLLTRASTHHLLKIGKTFPRVTASFGTSYSHRKTMAESVKEQAKKVNQTFTEKIVDGINAGQSIAGKAKDMSGMSGEEAKGKAEEKAEDLKSQAKDKKEEVKKSI